MFSFLLILGFLAEEQDPRQAGEAWRYRGELVIGVDETDAARQSTTWDGNGQLRIEMQVVFLDSTL